MKTSTLIISLLCLTVAMAQDNQDNQDKPPDGDQAFAEESESDLTELQLESLAIIVGKFVGFVGTGLIIVFHHFLTISIANLLEISFSTLSLVNIPLAGNVLLTIKFRWKNCCLKVIACLLGWGMRRICLEKLSALLLVAYFPSTRTICSNSSPTSFRSASQH